MEVNHKDLSQLRHMMMAPGSRKVIQDFIDTRTAKQQQRQQQASAKTKL